MIKNEITIKHFDIEIMLDESEILRLIYTVRAYANPDCYRTTKINDINIG